MLEAIQIRANDNSELMLAPRVFFWPASLFTEEERCALSGLALLHCLYRNVVP